MELWDTNLTETSVMLKITNEADKPKVFKDVETELSVILLQWNPLIWVPKGHKNMVNGVVLLKGFLK